MISLIAVVLCLFVAYLCNGLYAFTRNLLAARAMGVPYVIIPWDQNGFLWMVLSQPLRPYLRAILPSSLWHRVSLTIFGFEFHERLGLYTQFAPSHGSASLSSSSASSEPLAAAVAEANSFTSRAANPTPRTYALVSPGKFELNTMEPAIAEQVLRRHRDFVPHDFTELFMSRFGPNVLISEGEAWARQRRLVAAVINERISRTVFAESVKQTEGLLAEVLRDGGPAGEGSMGETTRLFDMMKKITINVLSGAGMGASVSWEDREEPKPGFRMTYIEGVKRVIHAVSGPLILPAWFLAHYPSFLPGHATLKGLSYAIEEFPTHTKDLLEKERERSLAAGGETRSNIMSQLLQASGEEKGNTALSEEEIMGNLFIFTAAGFDTTANTLSYALVLMARYPAWQQWVCEEIDAIMPREADAELEYAAIYPKATRVMATMLETLRLYSPVVHMAKMTRTPQTVQTATATYHIPAKATVFLNNICLHMDPEVWRNVNLAPTEEASDLDESVFRPTRWVNPPTESLPLYQPPKGSFIPWSSGPRVCPGQKMAQVEFTSIFLTLFRRHRIEAVALPLGSNGKVENQQQIADRLDRRLLDSISILTLQMNDVYDVPEGKGRGLKLRLVQR